MYQKIIRSGNVVEIYTYDKEPPPYRPRKKTKFKNPRRRYKNVQSSRASFFRLVQANVCRSSPPAFLTLTMREVVSLGEGWRAFKKFFLRLQYNSDTRIRYIAVPEFQKRGAVHFHCLVFGFTHEEIIGERLTRRIAKLWGHGFVDIRPSDGSPALAGYLAKYMSKAMFDERLSGKRAYSASRSLLRSVSLRSKTAISLIEAEIAGARIGFHGEIEEGVDKPLLPEKEVQYMTKWLGSCNYKRYTFSDVENKS